MSLLGWKTEFSSEFAMLKTIGGKLALWLLILAAVAYPLSGIYVVGVNETGILKRFGRIVDAHVAPGLHYRLPWPVDKVVKISTGEIHRFQTGFGANPTDVADFERRYGNVASNPIGSFLVPYCITGDKNIIHTKVIAQYRIDDPKAYLVGFKDPEAAVLRCIQSAILRAFSCRDVDTALTTGRVALQQQILRNVQRELAGLNTGIIVFSTEIKNARPPSSVAEAFKDVINAREERRTMIHDAQAYRNEIIPQGKAEAARLLNDAEAYKKKKIAHSRGESQRFTLLADEYSKDPNTTGQRLYFDAVSEILPTARKIIIGSDGGRDIANVRFFTQGGVEATK